ncbi:esterase/lipase family protein [Nocardioides sp.]|uniref:esterase/lipase family protein n=1 Tax=Nocardioides sp. TaxID=35761 RepID=UPI003515E0A8
MKRLIRSITCTVAASLGLAVAAGVTAPIAPADAASSSTTAYREGGIGTAIANFVVSPASLPGVNDWSCRPSAAHPQPVILEHATFVNLGSNFVKLAPRLLNQGYCVFAENYGLTATSLGRIGGLGAVTNSVASFGRFVDRVRAATGSAKVDVVGHSQGGLIAYAYIKSGGASKVDDYISWGGSQNGTTLSGLASLASALGVLGFAETFAAFLQAPGVTDQARGSAFMTRFLADHTVPAGPDYVTIQTRYDTVVTPYASQSIPGTRNLVVQNYCPGDRVGHVGLFLDEPTLQLTLNALAGGPSSFRPTCSGYGPAL